MKQKSLLKNTVLNIIRQICTILFPLITFPYISRVLGIENYGKINFSQSVLSYFTLIAAFGITNYAIREGTPLRNDKKKLSAFCNEVFSVNLITTLIAYVLLFVLLFFYSRLQDYALLIWIQSLSLFLTTLGVEWIFCIFEDFTYITLRSIFVQILSLILMFSFVHQPEDYIAYALLLVLANGGANLFNFLYSRKFIRIRFTFAMHFWQHIKVLTLLFFNSIMMTIYVNSDITLLGLMKNDTEVGLYSVSVKIYTILKNLVNAVFVAILPRVSALWKEGMNEGLESLLDQCSQVLLLFLFPMLTGLFCEAKNLLILISGKEYADAAAALQILCAAMFFSVFANFYVNLILLPNRKDRSILFISSASAILNVMLNLFFIHCWGYIGAALTTLIAEALVFFLSWFKSRTLYHLHFAAKNLVCVLSGCLGIVLLCTLFSGLELSLLLKEAFLILACIFFYFIVLLAGKNELLYSLLDKLKAKFS